MNQIRRKLAVIVRRLQIQVGLRALSVGVFAVLWAFVLVVLLDRIFYLGAWIPYDLRGLAIVSGATLAVGVIAFVAAAVARRPSELAAAVEIDERLGLKARISTALEVAPLIIDDDHDASAMARAVVEDAAQNAQRINVKRAFPYSSPRLLPWLLLPLALLLLLALALPPFDLLGRDATAKQAMKRKKDELTAVRKILKKRRVQIKEFRKQAERHKLPADVRDFSREIEKVTKDLARDADARKALKELGKLRDKIADEKKNLAQRADTAKMAARLKKMAERGEMGGSKETEKFAQAMKQGDYKKAAQALREFKKRLEEKLENNQLSQQEMVAAQRQLNQLSRAMERLQSMRGLKNKLDQGAQNMLDNFQDASEAIELTAEQLDQLRELDQLARDLPENEQFDFAGEPLTLEDLEDQLAALQDLIDGLDDMRTEIGMSTDCQQCNGTGKSQGKGQGKSGKPCGACNGSGSGLGRGMSMGAGGRGFMLSRRGGSGPFRRGDSSRKGSGTGGPGKGRGGRPGEQEDDVDFRKTQAKSKFHRQGKIIGTMLYKGLPGKGPGRQEYEEVHRAAEQAMDDSLEKTRVPMELKTMVKQYFDDISPEKLRTPKDEGAEN